MTDHRSRTLLRKIAAVTMAVWFVFLSFGVPQRVRAQGGPVTEGPPLGPLWLQREAAEFVDRAMKDSFKFQLQMAMINAMQFFFERFAYETAVWLASGGKAQSPLFNRETALNFLADSALGAGLQFVDNMDTFAAGQLGFDGPFGVAQFICSPTIPSIKLSLKLGLADRLKPRQPLCTWSQLSGNWDAFTQGGFGATLSRSLSQTGIAFEPGQSDLSAGLELHIGLGEKQAQVAFTKLNESLSRNMFRPLDEKISGLTKTPSSIVRGKAEQAYVQQPNESQKVNQEFALQSISTFEHFWPMLGAAGEALAINFGVTLFSQVLQQQVLNKGIFLGDANAGLGGDEESSSPPAAREQQARTAFAELQRPRFVSSGDYDQLTELASCDPQRRLLTTCAIDEGFVEAVRYAQSNKPITVAEALAAGLLHTDWPLIKVGTAKDQDPNCSKGPPTGGYCASNLQKLRRARIIPIGWELAANHEANSAADPVRLGQVVDAFHRNGIDGICGNADAEESPYCGLIDPNWVLTYPIQQCQLRGPGELLLGSGTAIRAESCVDAPSCLERDGEGKCVGGYGYCVREKNIWHLAGQSCPGQYASCRAFSSREGAALAVLTSTIDRSVCTAENAGCRWYSSSRDAAGNWESGNRRYLNRLAEACTEANEGCTELLAVKSAARNIALDGGFSSAVVGSSTPSGWVTDAPATIVVRDDGATDGNYLRCDGDLHSTSICRAILPVNLIRADTTYTLSAAIRATVSPSGFDAADLRVAFQDQGGVHEVCGLVVPVAERDGQWRTYRAICRTGSTIIIPRIVVLDSTDNTATTTIDVDQVMLVEGEVSSPFHDGYDASAPRTYLKVASPDLRCYDVSGDGQLNTANDHASCPSFAAGCTEADVGCERFTPQDGSPTVNGQFSDIDRCPAECVGYAAFREVESAFDQKDTFDFFIPSTARQCSAAEVGCSEFTNMDALERGGEQREYFSQLRRCEKPGEATSATYYTWEGSDQQGYQLRSFVLQRGAGSPESAPPEVFGYEALENVNCGPAPPTGTGTGHYGKRPTDAGYDSTITPDCRAFYSQNGDINYRRLSRTILMTDDCVRYRTSHQVDSGTCIAAGGTFSATAGCTIKGHRLESQQCQPASAGCRAYRGNAGGAIQTIVATDFEAEVNGQFQQGWVRVSGAGSLSTSLESLSVGGRSIRLTGGQTGEYPLRTRQTGFTSEQCAGQGGTFTAPDDCALPRLRAGGTYELIVVGKGTAQIDVGLQQVAGGVTANLIDLSVTPDRRRATLTPTWQRVVIGPLILAPSLTPTADASLWITATGGTVFLDSVLFREVPQQTTVIKDSWRTPQACDRASIADNAAPLAQGMLGCRAYQTRTGLRPGGAQAPEGGIETLRSFSRLCRAEVVGCTAFHDTRNSVDLGSQTFNNPSPDPSSLDDVTVPADAIRYLVDDRAKYCQAAAKGCARFGKPTLDRTANRENPPATDWADAFLLDQPDRYTGPGAILCEHPSLFCEEYRGQDGTVIYFKDPGNRTCEYREGVMQPGGIPASGWFRSGSDPPAACDPGLLIGGAQYGIWRNADTNYAGWSGLCQAGYDHCTEFVDPADRTLAHPNGQPYHAIRTTVDFASCQGGVSQKEGCVVLSDSSDPSTRFSAEASLAVSDLQQGARVPVVNCDAPGGACRRCVVERKCRADDGHVQGTRAGEPPLPPGAPAICLSDRDCGDGVPAGFRCRGGEVGPTCATPSASSALSDAQCDNEFNPRAVCRSFTNDGNAIIKVQRDRSCGQWLACRSATEARDPGLQRSINVCESIDLCESYQAAGGGSTAFDCARWVSGEETQDRILTRQLYQQRNRGWTGQEYSGYSLTGTYQAHELVPVNVSIRNDRIDMRLVRLDPNCWGQVDRPLDPNDLSVGRLPKRPSCTRTATDPDTGRDVTIPLQPGTCDGLRSAVNPDIQGTPQDESRYPTRCGDDYRGICVNHKCIYGIDGSPVSISPTTGPPRETAPPSECRIYPEVDSPFPDTVATFKEVRLPGDEVGYIRTGSQVGYSGANVCERGEGACGCTYQAIQFGDQPRYYSQSSRAPPGLCDGGFTSGEVSKAFVQQCTADAECEDERTSGPFSTASCGGDAGCTAQVKSRLQHGKCKSGDRRERFFGLTGICLERDQSISLGDDPTQHPCVSWYPVQQLAGGVDLYNQYERAGFHEEAQYCTDVMRYEYRRHINGGGLDACAIGLLTACGVLSGGSALVSCIAGGLATGVSVADMCQNDDNYEIYDWEIDWRTPFWDTWCPPFFDIQFHCRPKSGVGWYRDPGGNAGDYGCGDDNDTPCGPEEQAFRCTKTVDVADVPTIESMNNIAWTDRTREVRNPEELFRFDASDRTPTAPMHPIPYRDSCFVFGQLPTNVDPENVHGGSGGAAKYWEIFPDSPEATSSLQQCPAGYVTTNTPGAPGTEPFGGLPAKPAVAVAARHVEDRVSGRPLTPGTDRNIPSLQGLFAENYRRWQWQSTTQVRQCSANSGDKSLRACVANSFCREGGDCGTVCRMVAGRCGQILPVATGYTLVGVGSPCTADTEAQCPGADSHCILTPGKCANDNTRACRSSADCAGGAACELPQGRCRGRLQTCTTNADCGGSQRCLHGTCSPQPPDAFCRSDSDCPAGTGPCDLPPLTVRDTGVQVNCSSGASCGGVYGPDSNQLRLVPAGICRPGCENESAKGDMCSTDAQCNYQGTCDLLPPEDTKEDGGEFVSQSRLNWTDVRLAGSTRNDSAGPQIASVRECTPEGSCKVKNLGRFTIGTSAAAAQDEEDVEAPGGLVTVQFYGWANRNQMPITEVRVDWGDDSEPSGAALSKYQNHKPYCATGDDLATSAFHCTGAPELTCEADTDCPGVGQCRGAYCRPRCSAETSCPIAGTTCTGEGVCVRNGRRCIGQPNSASACTSNADCQDAGEGGACVDVEGTALHKADSCVPGEDCSVSFPPARFGQCVGFTSFGDVPDACNTTPFTFRHTYRCNGVDDDAWISEVNGCVFVPRVFLKDNWGWCTKVGGAEKPFDIFCRDNPNRFIAFPGRVIVR